MNVKLLSIKKSHQLVGALHIFRVDSPYPPLVMNTGKKIHRIDLCNWLLGSALQKDEEENYKTRNTGRLIICQGVPSWSPKVPSSCGTAHAPWIWNMKTENAITNQIEGLPRDLLMKMNWRPNSHRSATNLSTVLKTGGLRKYKVALWPDMEFIATFTTGGRGKFFPVT